MLRTRRLAPLLALALFLVLPLPACSRSKPPTLAYSGWPMADGDSARTNHSRFTVPSKVKEKHVINVRCRVVGLVLGVDGTLYVAGERRSRGLIQALTPDGDEKWEFLVPTPKGYEGSMPLSPRVTVSTDGVYLTSGDFLYALSQTGEERWVFRTRSPIIHKTLDGTTRMWLRSSPAIASDGTIYFAATDGFVYAVNPDGSKKWEYRAKEQLTSTPAIGSDGTIYAGDDDGFFYALDPGGSLKWRFKAENGVSEFLVARETIYVIGEGPFSKNAPVPDSWGKGMEKKWKGGPDYDEAVLHALDLDGKEKWTDELETVGRQWHLALGRPGLVADADRMLVLNENGEREWTFETEFAAASMLIDREGTILRVRDDGIVEVISRGGQEGWAEGVGRFLGGAVLAGDGLMYVWEDSKIIAIKD